ncbi:MAG: hypothetical protein JWM76_3594 [Pseudonocardiales bacterium]|nr:hypothetical protein [Pseudonocardiales bacterium]
MAHEAPQDRMSEPNLPVSAITESSDRLFIDIPWAPVGYLVEVAWIEGDDDGHFYVGVTTDTEFPQDVWEADAATLGELDDALDECPIPSLDRTVLTPTVRQMLTDKAES